MKLKFIKAAAASLLLTLSGFANAALILDERFDPINASEWTLSNGNILGDPASEFFDLNALHFSGSGERSATTNTFDMTSGGFLSFMFKIGGPLDTNTFEDAESGEDVAIRYSNDGGAWVNLLVIDTENILYRDTWGLVSIDLSSFSLSANTRFQWLQIDHSGSVYDHWAIDNVQLSNGVAVPEPSTLAIFALGVLGLVSRRYKKS